MNEREKPCYKHFILNEACVLRDTKLLLLFKRMHLFKIIITYSYVKILQDYKRIFKFRYMYLAHTHSHFYTNLTSKINICIAQGDMICVLVTSSRVTSFRPQ